MTRTPPRKVAAGFASAVLVLIVIGVFSYRGVRRVITDDGWTRHTRHVQLLLGDLFGRVKDAEAGARAYIIAADERYLVRYMAAQRLVETKLSELRAMTTDNRGSSAGSMN